MLEVILSKLRTVQGGSLSIALLTSRLPSDDPLEETAKQCNITCVRGSLDDVADRTRQAIDQTNVEYFFRINGDSPFLQPRLLDEACQCIVRERPDLLSNLRPRHYPYGISVEAIRSEVFYRAITHFSAPAHHEHITSYFYEHPELFSIYWLKDTTLDCGNVRMTVDTPADYQAVCELLKKHPGLLSMDIPQLLSIFTAGSVD